MASIGCPFCTKTGVAMVITSLALVLLSITTTIPWIAILGLVFLIAAYIVPSIVSGKSCHEEGCTNPSHKHGEENS